MANLYQKAIYDMVLEFAGQQRNLTVPRFFIELLEGDIVAALLLSQIIFWRGNTLYGKHGIAKSNDDILSELGIASHKTGRIIKKLLPVGVSINRRPSQ